MTILELLKLINIVFVVKPFLDVVQNIPGDSVSRSFTFKLKHNHTSVMTGSEQV